MNRDRVTGASSLERGWEGSIGEQVSNREMRTLMMALSFRAMGVERLGIFASVENKRSRAAQAKVGFKEEGVLRRFHLHNGEWHDVAVSSMLPDEYAASPLSAVPVEIVGAVPANWSFGD